MYKVYKVVSGDTLESIAKKFNTTIQNLQDINDKDYISLGDFIVVPNNTKDEWFDVYSIKKGDNLYSIAEEYNLDLVDLLSINGLDKDNYIYPGQEILVPKKNINIIITKDKETVNSASKRLGLNGEELLFQNDDIFLLPEQLLINKK